MKTITNLHQLTRHLEMTRNDIVVDYIVDEDKQIRTVHLGDLDNASIINITCTEEYEHLDSYDVEINYNYSGEYEFKGINFKHVLYLLYIEQVIK